MTDLIRLLVVRNWLDNVLSSHCHRLVVASNLALIFHAGGRHTQFTWSSVHAGVLLLSTAT